MHKRLIALCLLPAVLSACAGAASVQSKAQVYEWHDQLSIVPRPAQLRRGAGMLFVWPRNVAIDARDRPERNAAFFLRTFLQARRVQSSVGTTGASVVIRRNRHHDAALGAEGYRLAVSRSGVFISANTAAGLFYGVQTLEQLCRGSRRLVTPPVAIADWPRYPWRGIHLDVSRHFFDVATVERYIDLAAHYKLNVFHWHLTDDQAWRIEIKKYPRLTWAGPYYSQAQVRALVQYAAQRNVTIVPEIEMPGHSSAARRAYPYSLALIDEVLGEVIALFPSRYVHIGGDEVAYSSSQIAMMAHAVQFLNRHGRRAVTWDDALAASLAKSTVMMSWHGEKSVIAALTRGYDVVASPDGPLYFDAYQGARAQEPLAAPHSSTLEQVYAFNPQPERAPGRVYGVQANVWTEHIATAQHLFYMVLPRELALAEIAWDAPQRKSWDDFLAHLPAQLDQLEQSGYVFRIPNVLFTVQAPRIAFAAVPGDPQAARAFTNADVVRIRLQGSGAVYYTTDGSQPSQNSSRYLHSITVRVRAASPVIIRAVSFPYGAERHSGVTTCIVIHTTRALPGSGYSRAWTGLISP